MPSGLPRLRLLSRQPGRSAATSWTVPIRRQGASIMLDGQVDGRFTVHWMLDTGASTSFIPRDLAKAMLRVKGAAPATTGSTPRLPRSRR